jgi:hypothetical protein
VNLNAVLRSPQIYVAAYGPLAFAYQKFIYGPFVANPSWFVVPIAVGQLAIGISLLTRLWIKAGLCGAMLFLLAITPLGVGSAFPCTLILIVGLVILYRKQ